MITSKQTALRLTPIDLDILDALRLKTGIQTRTELMRLAIRRLAQSEGVDAMALSKPAEKTRRPAKKSA